jgi:Methylase of chemotaxis methyl-accepting proteins
MNELLNRWNQQYFDGKLSPAILEFLKDLPNQSDEVQSFVERMFRFMNLAGFPARDFSVILGWAIGFMPSRILPGAWGGLIPPITLEGRHIKIDDYLAINPWKALRDGSKLLDLGCGFPPHTTLDTAKRFPHWQITGADPSFGRYIVYDERGNYACFREDRTIRYFQPSRTDLTQWDVLYSDPEAARAHFSLILDELLSGISDDGNELVTIEKSQGKLICNPLRLHERKNVQFREGGIGALDVTGFDAVRCFNVLMYFDSTFRQNALEWVANILKPDGIFICGLDWARSSAARYSVYRKESGTLQLKEFAFSIDNIRALQIVSWFALHDDDFETNQMVHAVRLLRSDENFLRDFDRDMDDLLANAKICPRGADGYLGGVEEGVSPIELERRMAAIEQELDTRKFTERAVQILRQAGYEAWRNCVGHIAFLA